MAPPWFTKATSCCFGFLTGTRAPLFSLMNLRLVAILVDKRLCVWNIAGSIKDLKLRCVRTIKLCPVEVVIFDLKISISSPVTLSPIAKINDFSTRYATGLLIGPLHDPVTWYKITYTGEQVAQWDFQNNAPAFVLEIFHCATCSPVILYHVNGSCKRLIYLIQISHKSLHMNQVVHKARGYPGFCSILGVILLPTHPN